MATTTINEQAWCDMIENVKSMCEDRICEVKEAVGAGEFARAAAHQEEIAVIFEVVVKMAAIIVPKGYEKTFAEMNTLIDELRQEVQSLRRNIN